MNNPMFNDGRVEQGAYEGLYVLPLAHCMCDSSWDFPSFCFSLSLEYLFDDDPTMYPTIDDARAIAEAINFETDAHRDAFVEQFPLTWST